MRATQALVAVLLLGAGAARATTTAPAAAPPSAAAPAPVPVGPLPRGLAAYAQPTIPATACKTLSASEARCAIPAMTAGRYLIEAAGVSTSQGAGAVQALEIDVGTSQCGVAKNSAAWPSGARTFRLDCAVNLMTDTPLLVRVLYADDKAVKDPKGPSVTIRPLPWNGILSAQPFVPQQ